MKLDTFQCPVCFSTHVRVVGDTYECLACGNVYTKRQMDSQMFIDLRIANSYRQFADFAKAKAMYEEIIIKYPDDDLSHAYWGLLLCDQMVMLEMDSTENVFPSFYRIKDEKLEDSKAYKKFISYIEKEFPEKLEMYQDRINIIEEAREKAVVISQTTKPYDVFICFKKTQLDSDIVTKDYDLANEIYAQLADQYRIFYSEKSLRGIKVREYEPNIFYGLYTAKVMLLICSKKEFLESHWLKNEWQRFLQLNKNKCVIPIFTDNFSPDDLPVELAHLQGLKYGISLMSDIEKDLSNIINPVDRDAEQEKQIKELMEQQRKLQEEWAKQQKMTLGMFLDENKNMSDSSADFAVDSILKLAKVNIEDLGNFDEADELISRAQKIDAENYMTWFYRLLIDFRAKNITNLIMHANYKDSINYRLLAKYAKTEEAQNFVISIDAAREDYLRNTANKVNSLLAALEKNPRPTNEDINAIKMLYESLDKEAKSYITDLKRIVGNAIKLMRENKISDFNCMVDVVEKKEHPNYDDIIKIQETYKNLSEEEQPLVKDYKQTVVEVTEKMKLSKAQIVQQSLIELDQKESPQRDEIIKVEKKFNNLEDEYKKYVKDYPEIMSRAYEKKYKQDAKILEEYLKKLPKDKVPNREIYTKLENRYRALPKKFRMLVSNITLLDDYYDRLIESEGGTSVVQKTTAPITKPATQKTEKPKKKFWLWS